MTRLLPLPLLFLVACSAGPMTSADDDSESAVTTTTITPFKELMIVHPSVVGDRQRTSNVLDGHWSFRWLMEQLSHDSDLTPGQFVEAWLQGFRSTQVPGTTVTLRDRRGVTDLLARWPRDFWGDLDLAYSPFRLMAIVNRIDKGTSLGNMGEGRFVFALVDPDTLDGSNPDPRTATPMSMTVIFEFHLPGMPKTPDKDTTQRQKNAKKWHALSALAFGERYNSALQAITDAFVTTYGPSSLNQLRTNEIALAGDELLAGQPGPGGPDQVWELREFKLVDGLLQAGTVQATAADAFNRDAGFAQYLVDHRADVLAGTVALGSYAGYSATESFSQTRWTFPDVGGQPFPEDVRFAFAKGTCNGCHNAEQSSFPAPQFPEGAQLGFLHLTPFPGTASPGGDLAGTERVSGFLKDKDLPRRATFVQGILADPNSLVGASGLAH